MNELLNKIELKVVAENNDLFYLGVAFMTKVSEKNKTKSEKKQPWWKIRLESQVEELNKNLVRLNAMLEGKKMKNKTKQKKQKHRNKLQKKQKFKEKGKPNVKEEILPRIRAKTATMNIYQQRVSQFQENRFFRNNQRQFHKQIDEVKREKRL